MIEKVISGGQSGADIAGIRAAFRFGIPTGGWAPKGWLVERRGGRGSEPCKNLRDFGLIECPDPGGDPWEPRWQYEAACYRARTARNAADADATLWFGRGDTRGFEATQREVRRSGNRFWTVIDPDYDPSKIVMLLTQFTDRVINVAGNRESKSPGIGAWVESYLCEVFRLLGFQETSHP